MELSLTGDGDKINITVGFSEDGPNAASTESLKLMFDLGQELRKILCCLLMREWWRFG